MQHQFNIVCQFCFAGDKISLCETMSGMEKMKKDQLLRVSHNARTRRQQMEFVNGRFTTHKRNVQLLVDLIATRYCQSPRLTWDQKVINHTHGG